MDIKQINSSFIVLRLIAIIMLSIALLRLPYGYYTLMRVVLCFSFCYFIYDNFKLYKNYVFYMIFGLLAIVYNPVFPLHLGREIWVYVNIVTIVVLILSFVFLRSKTKAT